MHSAYGRKLPPPDELTLVDPGTPMGELLRRYCQPVSTSDELRDLSKKVKILCEELVVFRDRRAESARSSRIAPIAAPPSSTDASRMRGFAAATTAGCSTRRATASRCHAK